MRAGLTLLLLLIVPATALSQQDASRKDVDSPGLLIEAAAGWDGTVDRSVPVSVAFMIRNDSDQMLTADLVLFDPLTNQEIALGEVVVSSTTARRVSTIQAFDHWDECFAELRADGEVLWRRELPLTTGNDFKDSLSFALFIDDGGRRLELPTLLDDILLYRPDLSVGGTAGRRVRCLSAKSWQVPNHPGPLGPVQAIIFPDQANDETLNEVQWIALAKWMCQGGAVFVHAESQTIVERLKQFAPLDFDAPDSSGAFAMQHVGLGALYQYSQPLLRSEGNETRSLIEATIARLPKSSVEPMLNSPNSYHRGSARAELNRSVVLLFFLGYALFIGVLSLVLFRLSQRRMAIYTGIVVGGASILSGLLGGYLRFSRGDLNWTTVTLASAGGLVQHGKLDVRSAGGRSTRVAVTGEDVDLQFVSGNANWYSWNNQRVGCPPFTWQTNLLPNVEQTYQANVAMTPWGRRELRATAFQRGMRPLQFELKLLPATMTNDGNGNSVWHCKLSLKLVNHLPFDLKNCMLVVGGTRPTNVSQPGPQGLNGNQQAALGFLAQLTNGQPAGTVSEFVDVYCRRPLGGVAVDESKEESFDVAFEVMQNDWNQMLQFPDGAIVPPKISHLGTSNAWIVGQIATSSILKIDEQHSDFDAEDEPVHLFVQQIRPEDLIDPDGFLRQTPQTVNASSQPDGG